MAQNKDDWTLEIGEDRCFHSGNRVAITTSGEQDGELWDATVAELWPADNDEDIRCGRLMTAAPDLLDALRAVTANTTATTPEAIAAFDQAERAITKAEPGPRGWTHAETGAPDDPTQKHDGIHFLSESVRRAIAGLKEACGIADPTMLTAIQTAAMCVLDIRRPTTPAAQAVERHIAEAQQDMPLPDLLAAILRRAERGRSYGKLTTSSKDACLDDVIRLAERAITLENARAANERANLAPFQEAVDHARGVKS